MEFEWDDAKAARNLRDHGVGFAKRPPRAAIRSPSSGSMIAITTARSGSIYSACAKA
jgi:hypothetical protein